MTDITPLAVEAAIALLVMSWGGEANKKKSKAIITKLVRAQAARIAELELDLWKCNQRLVIEADSTEGLEQAEKRIAELEGRHTAIMEALDKISNPPATTEQPQICRGDTTPPEKG